MVAILSHHNVVCFFSSQKCIYGIFKAILSKVQAHDLTSSGSGR